MLSRYAPMLYYVAFLWVFCLVASVLPACDQASAQAGHDC